MVQRQSTWPARRDQQSFLAGASVIHQTVIKPVGILFTITDAMNNEPLSFDVIPGKTAETRVFQVHGPITLSNLFDFQKALMGGTEKVTIVDLTDSPYMDSAGL